MVTDSPLAAAATSPLDGVPVLLLSDIQGAHCMSISRRKFNELRNEPWMPKPIVLGPRLVRYLRTELEQAIANAPRQDKASEPTQLLRGKIERMKRGARE